MAEKDRLDSEYWEALKEKSVFAGITLDPTITPEDFRLYGDRLGGRFIAMFERFGARPLAAATIADIGCGLGRLSLPFSRRFSKVIGIDINRRILEAGAAYCAGADNIAFVENDGRTIPLGDQSVDYVFCGGVIQHLKDVAVIQGYFREGLRVAKPGGTLIYVVQTWMDGIAKGGHIGAKLTARDIDAALAAHDCAPLALVDDPADPLPHMSVVIRALSSNLPTAPPTPLTPALVLHERVRTGIWEDLPSFQRHHAAWARPRRPVTFWD